jgi:hypothetical protein
VIHSSSSDFNYSLANAHLGVNRLNSNYYIIFPERNEPPIGKAVDDDYVSRFYGGLHGYSICAAHRDDILFDNVVGCDYWYDSEISENVLKHYYYVLL